MMFREISFAEKLRNANIKIQIVFGEIENVMWSEHIYIFFLKLQFNCIMQFGVVK